MPPVLPLNASCDPSGDQVGPVTDSSAQVEPLRDFPRADVEHVEDVLAAPLRRERELLPVGRERALRVEEAQLLEVRVVLAADELRRALARLGVAEPEVDEHLAAPNLAVREEGDRVSVGRERGARKMSPSLCFLLSNACANFRGRSITPIAGSRRV